jgi:tellurite resistance protein TerC
MIFAAESSTVSPWMWIGFIAIVPPLLALELYVVPRHNPIPLRPALWFSLLWFVLGAGFAIIVGLHAGDVYAKKYLSGFFVEKGLTIDQVLVFAIVLRRFKAPGRVSRRVLFIALWVGLLLRLPFIALGVYLGESERPIVQIGVALLFVLAAVVLVRSRHHEHDPLEGPLVQKLLAQGRVAPVYEGRRYLTRQDGRRVLTMAGLLLTVLLSADLFFAATVPLGFSFSKPGFIVFTSSTFAILGFRSLYYLADGLDIDVARLKIALGVVFVVVAIDLLSHPYYVDKEPTWLIPVLGLLAIAVPVGSAVRGIERELEEEENEPGDGGGDLVTDAP